MNEHRAIWERLHRDPRVRAILREYRAALDAEGASVLLVEDDHMRFCAAEGLNGNALEGEGDWDRAMRIALSAERGINSIAALMGKALCMKEEGARHDRTVDEMLGQETRSVMAIPIVADGTVVGTLSAINPHASAGPPRRDRFDETDMGAGETFAAAIGARIAQ